MELINKKHRVNKEMKMKNKGSFKFGYRNRWILLCLILFVALSTTGCKMVFPLKTLIDKNDSESVDSAQEDSVEETVSKDNESQSESEKEKGFVTTKIVTDNFIWHFPNGFVEDSTEKGELIGVNYYFTEEEPEEESHGLMFSYEGSYLNNEYFDKSIKDAEIVQGDRFFEHSQINRENMTIDIYRYGIIYDTYKIYISSPALNDGQPMAALAITQINDVNNLEECRDYYSRIFDFVLANVEVR